MARPRRGSGTGVGGERDQRTHQLTVTGPRLPSRTLKTERVTPAPPAGGAESDLNLVWVQLRGDWSWLVTVAGDPSQSTANLARALCQVGSRLSVSQIDFVEATNVDLDNSAKLIAQLGTEGDSWREAPANAGPGWTRPLTRTIVALESPLANPLALPIALAADGVILCVQRGRDHLSAVRETIQAVGADRIVCCVLVD